MILLLTLSVFLLLSVVGNVVQYMRNRPKQSTVLEPSPRAEKDRSLLLSALEVRDGQLS
jgi:hypothetical protein